MPRGALLGIRMDICDYNTSVSIRTALQFVRTLPDHLNKIETKIRFVPITGVEWKNGRENTIRIQ